MRRDRSLTAQEALLWRRVADTVRPLVPPRRTGEEHSLEIARGDPALARPPNPTRHPRPIPARPGVSPPQPPARSLDQHGLDAGWDRKLARGLIDPDFTLDLHGATLDMAYGRLGQGLAQAQAMGVRVVLLITGRSRPVDAADRGRMRGAIRAKIGDWIAAGEHGAAIAAIRPAHRRHGGPGALYLVLRRRRG